MCAGSIPFAQIHSSPASALFGTEKTPLSSDFWLFGASGVRGRRERGEGICCLSPNLFSLAPALDQLCPSGPNRLWVGLTSRAPGLLGSINTAWLSLLWVLRLHCPLLLLLALPSTHSTSPFIKLSFFLFFLFFF